MMNMIDRFASGACMREIDVLLDLTKQVAQGTMPEFLSLS